MSVCVCVCLCVRPIFWYFISRILEEYIDLKFIQETYRVVLNSLGKNDLQRDGTLFFEGTVISQKLSHRKISIFFVDTSVCAISNETIKIQRAEK